MDEAILYGHDCLSKRGRKKREKISKLDVPETSNYENIKPDLVNNEENLCNDYKETSKIDQDNFDNDENLLEEESKENFMIPNKIDDEIILNISDPLDYDPIGDSNFIQTMILKNDAMIKRAESLSSNKALNPEEISGLLKEIKEGINSTQHAISLTKQMASIDRKSVV